MGDATAPQPAAGCSLSPTPTPAPTPPRVLDLKFKEGPGRWECFRGVRPAGWSSGSSRAPLRHASACCKGGDLGWNLDAPGMWSFWV